MIGPGTETHAGRLDCYGCGKFRTWLPRAVCSFVTACINAAGTLTLIQSSNRDRTITVGDQQMAAPEKGFQSKPDTGALFRNGDKQNDEDRDYSGSLNVDSADYWISGWIKVSKKGTKYLSLSIKPKDEPATKAGGRPPLNDEIPFAPEWR